MEGSISVSQSIRQSSPVSVFTKIPKCNVSFQGPAEINAGHNEAEIFVLKTDVVAGGKVADVKELLHISLQGPYSWKILVLRVAPSNKILRKFLEMWVFPLKFKEKILVKKKVIKKAS